MKCLLGLLKASSQINFSYIQSQLQDSYFVYQSVYYTASSLIHGLQATKGQGTGR